MKKLTTISLFIFWAITAAILTAGLVFYQDRTNLTGQNNALSQSPSAQVLPEAEKAKGLTLNLTEISKHNSPKDCWLIINNKIYSVAGYLSAHPGGAAAIMPYCGKEATQAFAVKGGNRGSHSNYADSLLAAYLVGNLNQAVTQEQVNQTTKNINTPTPPIRNRGDDEDD